MKIVKSKLFSGLLMLLLFLPLTVFAGGQQEAPVDKGATGAVDSEIQAAESITVTDALGREVTINGPIERIAFSISTTGEMLKIVGAWDMVVGVDWETANQPVLFPNIDELPVINSMTSQYDLNYESIYTLDPDVILVISVPTPGLDAMIEKLDSDIPVVAIADTSDPDAWTNGVSILGKLLDRESVAMEFTDWYKSIENGMKAKTALLSDNEKPKVFFKTVGMSPEQVCTYTNQFGYVRRLLEVSGGINIGADIPAPGGWVQNVDPEWLVKQNPDVVMAVSWEGYYSGALGFGVEDSSTAEAVRTDMMAMPIFQDCGAVANQKFFLFDTYFTSAPRFIVLMAYWGKWLHPDLFADIDPKSIHQEYLTRFMGIDYDLDQQGVFFYPEP
ncbi:MAG: ABC transporter substrate-binding protein [Spirochaetales bacterium]|nr:ABC transporter substrate-binding protein [Spirochaetales bacterium]